MDDLKKLVEDVFVGYTEDNCVTPDTIMNVNAYELRDKIVQGIRNEIILYQCEEDDEDVIKGLLGQL